MDRGVSDVCSSVCSSEVEGDQLIEESFEGASLYVGTLDLDLELSEWVLSQGYPNVCGAKIPIPTHLNLDKSRELIQGYHDQEVVEFLTYGWPTNHCPGVPPPTINAVNHNSAVLHPEFFDNYIETEINLGVTMGPYDSVLFQSGGGGSPLVHTQRGMASLGARFWISATPGNVLSMTGHQRIPT